MKRKDSNQGASIRSLLGNGTGTVNFLRITKKGVVYFVGDNKKKKNVIKNESK